MTKQQTNSFNIVLGTLFLLAALLVSAPQAHADGFDFDIIDTFSPDMGGGYDFYGNDVIDYYPNDVVDYYPNDVVDYYPNDTYATDYDPTYFSGGYGSTGYSSGGYMTGGYMGGGFVGGGVLTGGGYIVPAPRTTPSNSVSNTCTAPNTCNTIVDDHSIFNAPTTINAPTTVTVTNPTTPTYNPPVCSGCGCHGSYCPPPVYHNNPPIAYNSTPYVSLSAIPYTGLELGFWGTIAYWGFLVLWCLVAAYLIVVKKVQNRILRSLNNFLFGTTSYEVGSQTELAYSAPAQTAPVTSVFSQADLAALAQMLRTAVAPVAEVITPTYTAPVTPQTDEIDSFVMSQVNRKRS